MSRTSYSCFWRSPSRFRCCGPFPRPCEEQDRASKVCAAAMEDQRRAMVLHYSRAMLAERDRAQRARLAMEGSLGQDDDDEDYEDDGDDDDDDGDGRRRRRRRRRRR